VRRRQARGVAEGTEEVVFGVKSFPQSLKEVLKEAIDRAFSPLGVNGNLTQGDALG
jgi:hypothetical protein